MPLELVWSGSPVVDSVPFVPEISDQDAYLLRLGKTVQRVRKRMLGITGEELAAEVGVEKNTISRWENGKTSLSAHDLVRLWKALNVPAEWILDPTDSVTEIDRRTAQLRRAAEVAARADAEAVVSRRDAGGKTARRGTKRP